MVVVLAAAAWRFHWNAGVSMFVYFLFGGFAFPCFSVGSPNAFGTPTSRGDVPAFVCRLYNILH